MLNCFYSYSFKDPLQRRVQVSVGSAGRVYLGGARRGVNERQAGPADVVGVWRGTSCQETGATSTPTKLTQGAQLEQPGQPA